MGAQASAPSQAVRPELLVEELLGELKEDDYYARSTHLLDNFLVDDKGQGNFDASDALPMEEAHKMVNPGYLNLEHGYVRVKDGTWYVACLTDLGYEVNGDMIDWWFCHCDSDEKYRWWHPQDHKRGTWDPQFYAVMPQERTAQHYIDHIQIVEEVINGESQHLQIEYERPSKLFDVTSFAENGITACILGRIYLRDKKYAYIIPDVLFLLSYSPHIPDISFLTFYFPT